MRVRDSQIREGGATSWVVASHEFDRVVTSANCGSSILQHVRVLESLQEARAKGGQAARDPRVTARRVLDGQFPRLYCLVEIGQASIKSESNQQGNPEIRMGRAKFVVASDRHSPAAEDDRIVQIRIVVHALSAYPQNCGQIHQRGCHCRVASPAGYDGFAACQDRCVQVVAVSDPPVPCLQDDRQIRQAVDQLWIRVARCVQRLGSRLDGSFQVAKPAQAFEAELECGTDVHKRSRVLWICGLSCGRDC
jgi:hypothetical protein